MEERISIFEKTNPAVFLSAIPPIESSKVDPSRSSLASGVALVGNVGDGRAVWQRLLEAHETGGRRTTDRPNARPVDHKETGGRVVAHHP
jgi:hypothetical protein